MQRTHLTETELADWILDPQRGTDVSDVAKHVMACTDCRERADRADALLDVAASLMAATHLDQCPDASELVGPPTPALRTHLQGCGVCQAVVGRSERSGRRPWWVAAGTMLVAAMVQFMVLAPDGPATAIQLDLHAGPVLRSENFAASEFQVKVGVLEPTWVGLLVLQDDGALSYLGGRIVHGHDVFGRFDKSRRTHAIVLLAPVDPRSGDDPPPGLSTFEHTTRPLPQSADAARRELDALANRLEAAIAGEAHLLPMR